MVRILASTIIRGGPQECNGYVYDIDWDSKKILHQQLVPSPGLEDLGPRGGARGARGVANANDFFYVANFNSILVYDSSWNQIDELTHPLFNGIHEIDIEPDGIWVSSTGLDAILKVDWDGNLLYSLFFGDLDEQLHQELLIDERPLDLRSDFRDMVFDNSSLVTHVNSVKIYDNRPYVCLNKQGSVVALDPFEIVVSPTGNTGFHNGSKVADDLFLANSSHEKKLYGFHKDGSVDFEINWLDEVPAVSEKDRQILQQVFHENPGDSAEASSGWTRGLAVLDSGTILIGMSPATIVEFDLSQKTVVDSFVVSEDVHHAIHGLTVVR